MTQEEMHDLLDAGKKITCSVCEPGEYICRKNGILYDEKGDEVDIGWFQRAFRAWEWEEFKDT